MYRRFLPILLLSLIALLSACSAPASDQTATGQNQLINPAAYVDQFGADTTFSRHFLVDVRTPEEFASGHIAGAVNIPVEELSAHLSEFPTDRPTVVYCRSGNRSATAASQLAASGYDVYDLGGIIDWSAAGFPVTQ
ncbi:MAG: rhodanese-like domain-containing protein [Anaerolineae bacterium]|nr:rhodanese-like domain-containing protein [Anaerolineae bacterium]